MEECQRGMTVPVVWLDEWAFVSHNQKMYEALRPAVSTASRIAKSNGTPYGILITTTPKVLGEVI